MQIFYTKKEDCIPLPMQSDEAYEITILKKNAVYQNYFYFFYFALLVFLRFYTNSWFTYTDLYYNLAIAFGIFVPFFISLLFLAFIYIIFWHFRCHRNKKRNKSLPHPSLTWAKARALFYSLSALIFVCFFSLNVLYLLSTTILKKRPFPIFLIFLVLFCLFLILKRCTKKEEKSDFPSSHLASYLKRFSWIAVFILGMLLFYFSPNEQETTIPPYSALLFTLEDFQQPRGKIEYEETHSILVPFHYNYSESNEDTYLSVEYIRPVYPKITQYIVQEIKKEYLLMGWKIFSQNVEQQKIHTLLIQFDTGKGHVLFFTDKEILDIYFSGWNINHLIWEPARIRSKKHFFNREIEINNFHREPRFP